MDVHTNQWGRLSGKGRWYRITYRLPGNGAVNVGVIQRGKEMSQNSTGGGVVVAHLFHGIYPKNGTNVTAGICECIMPPSMEMFTETAVTARRMVRTDTKMSHTITIARRLNNSTS